MVISKLETRVRTTKRHRAHAEYSVRKMGLLQAERKFHHLKVTLSFAPLSDDRRALNLARLGAMVRCTAQWKGQPRNPGKDEDWAS